MFINVYIRMCIASLSEVSLQGQSGLGVVTACICSLAYNSTASEELVS